MIWNVTTLAIARDSARRFEVGPGEVEAGTAVFFNHTARSILFLLGPLIFILGLFVFAPQLAFFGIPPKPVINNVYLRIDTTYVSDCFTFLTGKTSFIYKHKQPLTLAFTRALSITAGITVGIAIVGLFFQ